MHAYHIDKLFKIYWTQALELIDILIIWSNLNGWRIANAVNDYLTIRM